MIPEEVSSTPERIKSCRQPDQAPLYDPAIPEIGFVKQYLIAGHKYHGFGNDFHIVREATRGNVHIRLGKKVSLKGCPDGWTITGEKHFIYGVLQRTSEISAFRQERNRLLYSYIFVYPEDRLDPEAEAAVYDERERMKPLMNAREQIVRDALGLPRKKRKWVSEVL